MRVNRRFALGFALLAAVLPAVACTSDEPGTATPQPQETSVALADPTTTPEQLAEDVDVLMNAYNLGLNPDRIERVGDSGDVRYAWYLADLMRFFPRSQTGDELTDAWRQLTGVGDAYPRGWEESTNYLIANDVPPPPRYAELKTALLGKIGPDWDPFFDDPGSEVDWRLISWGGVAIDDRPIDQADRGCGNCIPALNDPPTTAADEGDWYPDDRLVFTIEVNGEIRAYPKNIMEVHEMVNDTIGGRRIALAYCTLCGTAQAFFTDRLPDGIETPTGTLELRTSGLLSRSNKVMFDLHTYSLFDTFRGRAISGPLHDAGLELDFVTVGTAEWGEFRAARPDATIVGSNTGLLGNYPLDPLGDRDADGPIFPIGEVDPRLLVQEQVLGVRHDGLVVAFPVASAQFALATGEPVEFRGITVHLEAGALVAEAPDGSRITTHQAYWFAWSQFYPETEVWSPR